jgi:hypothetical protein
MRVTLANAAFAATLCLVAGMAILILAAPDAPLQDAWGFRGGAAVLAVAFGGVGALVALRVPGNRIGALLVAIGFWAAAIAFSAEYAVYGLTVAPGSVPFALAASWLATWVWVPFAGLSTTFLVLVFPDGRLLSPRWRPVAWLAAVAIAVTSAAMALLPGPINNVPTLDNPLGVSPSAVPVVQAMASLGFVLLAIAVVLSAVSLVLRVRRSTGVARQQLKWFATAAVFAGLTLAGPATLFNLAITGDPSAPTVKAFEILTMVALLTVPIAVGIAVLRYRLYEIDRLISRTISWAIVTGLLVASFVVLILALSSILEPLTGGSTLAVTGSTLVTAALFAPLRNRVQRAVDRRFDRSRYDGERLLAAFGVRRRNQVDLVMISDDVLATVDAAVRPAHAGLWLREPAVPS